MAGAVGHRLLNTKSAVKYLGGDMSSKKLRRYKGSLGAVKLGSLWYWPAGKLDDWVAGRIEAIPDDLDQPRSRSRKRRSRAKAGAR